MSERSSPIQLTRRITTSRAVLIAYAVVFIAFVDNFSMLPTIGPFTQYLGGSALAMGIAVAAYSVTNLMFNIVGGIMLDRSGRRRLLLIGLILAALSMVLYTTVTSVSGLIVIRLIHGAAGGILVPAVFTTIADLAPLGKSGRTMGRAGALIGSAAILSPALAGILRQTAGFNTVFLVTAALLGIGAVLAGFGLPETANLVAPRKINKAKTVSTVKHAIPPGIQVAYWGVFTLTFAMGALTAFLPEIAESLGYGAGTSGLLFTAFGLVAALIMISPLAQLVDRRGVVLPVSAGLAVVAVSLIILVNASTLPWIIIACMVFGSGYGLLFPSTSGGIAAASSPGRTGRAYGIFYAMFSLGIVAGAPLGGLFKGWFPATANPYLPAFLPAFIMCLLGLAVTLHLGRKIRQLQV